MNTKKKKWLPISYIKKILYSLISGLVFFATNSEKRHNVIQVAGPIVNCFETPSKSLDETLVNWTDYYKKLYFKGNPIIKLPTHDNDEILDGVLELSEFQNVLYSLNPHKSPGYDGLTHSDLLSLISN